jgi:hypothetical protein
MAYPNTSHNSSLPQYPPSAPLQSAQPQARSETRSPRLALLATVLFNPVILVGYYLYWYGPGNTCVAGSLICSFGHYAGIVQVFIIVAGCAPYGERFAIIRGLRAITNTSKIRPLLLTYGLLLLLGLFIGLLKEQLNAPITVLCLFTVFACLYSALGGAQGGAA